ncbi:MAG TPA: hypothetical protein VHK06_07920 [Candidatus Limnocylindria bacterium]|nr:hypothetical protein [Candidatus Limnocylindria bacterium]
MRRLQGAWYLVTGAWALLHRPSFEAVTGPKREYWLVQATAGLTMAIGAVLVLPSPEPMAGRRARLLSLLSALAFAGVELRHGLPGRIRAVYLLDALGELAFAGSALLTGSRRRGGAARAS